MPLTLIVAAAENGAIGLNGSMPWNLPDDLKHFRRITLGHAVVMGRKTWEALPKKPLDGRRNIVLSTSMPDGAGYEVCRDSESLLAMIPEGEEWMIIGGATIYSTFLPLADKIYLTMVHADYEADTFMPELKPAEWHVIDSVYHPADERHISDFTFLTQIRRKDV
jgi:dihydrofolate reductase